MLMFVLVGIAHFLLQRSQLGSESARPGSKVTAWAAVPELLVVEYEKFCLSYIRIHFDNRL
jgi:hypothetical protein